MHALLTPYTDREIADRLAALVAAETARRSGHRASRGTGWKPLETRAAKKKNRAVHFVG